MDEKEGKLAFRFILALLAGDSQPDNAQTGHGRGHDPIHQVVAGLGDIRQLAAGNLGVGDINAGVSAVTGIGAVAGVGQLAAGNVRICLLYTSRCV